MSVNKVLVSMAVLVMGFSPAHSYVDSSDGGSKSTDLLGINSEIARTLASMKQEGSGRNGEVRKDEHTVAGFCALGNCNKQEEGEEIKSGPYAGYRVYKTKIVGGFDSRELVGPHDSDHSAAVGMVYCEKSVIENGKRRKVLKITTGTLVGDTQTVMASAHSQFIKGPDGVIKYSFDYRSECEYRKYVDGDGYYSYSFSFAKTGGYVGKVRDEDGKLVETPRSGDWSFLRLDRKARGQKAVGLGTVNTDKIKLDSKFPIKIIAHQHDKNDDFGLYSSEGIMKATTFNGEKSFAHTADTNGRASGAALVFENGRAYGIHVSSYDQMDLNRFIPITDLIFDAFEEVKSFSGVSI